MRRVRGEDAGRRGGERHVSGCRLEPPREVADDLELNGDEPERERGKKRRE